MLLKITYILFIILELSSRINSANILGLFTSPHKSHMLVYFGVVNSLLRRGHNITVVTVSPVDDMLPRDIRVIQLKKPPEADPMRGIFRQIAVVAANSRTFYDPRFQEFLKEDNRFDLVILGYLFNDYQLGVAARFNCPSVVIWTTQPISFVNRFIKNPNGWSYVPQPFVRSQAVGLRGILYGLFDTVIKFIFDIIMENVYRDIFPSNKYPTLAEMRKNVSLVLCNHHFSEGPIAAHLPSHIEISGIQIQMNKSLPEALEQFLRSAEHGVIYFSLGTVVSPKRLKPAMLQIFIKVFSSLPQRVIWKIDSIPHNFTNIMTGKWFPQSSVLDHPNTKLFITHGGKGSIVESLHYAVPMIAIPIFGDQFADAYRIVRNGFGSKLDINSITEESLRQHIDEVLTNNVYARNIKRASEIYRDRPFSHEEETIFWIEYIIRHRGASHMQTPTKFMNLIQYLNIDVYLFLLCCCYAANAAIKIVLFNISRIVSSSGGTH